MKHSYNQILISVGESSGDFLGAEVMATLLEQEGASGTFERDSLSFSGTGGPQMRALGLKVLEDQEQMAVNGLWAVLPKIPLLWRLKNRWKNLLKQSDVAKTLVVLVDYPGFNFGLLRWAHQLGFRVVWLAPPQVWAWKSERVRKLLGVPVGTLFEFEQRYLHERGVQATWIGHPLAANISLENVSSSSLEVSNRAETLVDEREGILLLFPGSRLNQLHVNLPLQLQVGYRLIEKSERFQKLVVVAPNESLRVQCENWVEEWAATWVGGVEVCMHSAELFKKASGALAVAGTSNLELQLAGVPCGVVMRVSKWTALMARFWLQTKWISLPNILLGREWVVEAIFEGNRIDSSVVDRWVVRLQERMEEMVQERESISRELYRLAGSGSFRHNLASWLNEVDDG